MWGSCHSRIGWHGEMGYTYSGLTCYILTSWIGLFKIPTLRAKHSADCTNRFNFATENLNKPGQITHKNFYSETTISDGTCAWNLGTNKVLKKDIFLLLSLWSIILFKLQLLRPPNRQMMFPN